MRFSFSLLILAVAATACDRGTTLTGRVAELVIVTGSGDQEVLTRAGRTGIPSAPMGESSSGTFLVRNIGDGPLTLTKVSLELGSTSFAIELPERTELRATEESIFTVTFTPEQASEVTLKSVRHQATFRIESEGGRDDEKTATIEIYADAEARDCYVPPLLDFGDSPIGQAVQIALDLSNANNTEAEATVSAPAGANPGFFSVDLPNGKVTVPSGAMAAAQIRFAPLTEADVNAEVTVRRRPSCPTGTTHLRGRGSNQSLVWMPSEISFGKIPLNETASRTVTFTNRSGAALPLSISTEGTDFIAPSATLTLPARGSLAVPVQCKPTSLSSLTGTLRVDVGTSPVLPVRVGLRCTGGGPRMRVSPSQLAFGSVPLLVDSANKPLLQSQQPIVVRRLRIENVGTPPPTPTDATYNLVLGREGMPPLMSLTPLGTTQQGEFSVSVVRYPAVGVPAVAGKNTIDVEVRLQPAGNGSREAALTIYSNDGIQPVQTVRITATTTTAESCSVFPMPASISYGDVSPDSTESATLALINPGNKACLVSGLELAPGSNSGFSIGGGSSSVTIGPNSTFNTQVRFDSSGITPGTVVSGHVRYTTADRTTRNIPLSARVARCLIVVPEEVEFGNIKLGCGSAPRAVQIFNSCSSPIRLMSLSTSGDGFAISAQPMIPAGGLSLSPNAGLTMVSVNFRPPALGAHSGVLTVTSTEGGGTRSLLVPLRGVGDTTGTTVETFAQPTSPQADILFTIDNSCSMADEQAALAMNFSSFISYATSTNVDYRIAVTTSDDFAGNGQGQFVQNGAQRFVEATTPSAASVFSRMVNVGISGSGYERPISTSLKALTPPLTNGANAGFLRDDANLAIIMVTDAPDQSPEPIAYYQTRMPLVKGTRRMHQVVVSAIGPFTAPSATCSIEGVDPNRYETLIQQTGGVKANICTQNWANDLRTLGNSALGPRNTFFVRNPPDTQQPIEVQVDGRSISNSWRYDSAANSIVFTQGQAPGAGTSLTITYQSMCL